MRFSVRYKNPAELVSDHDQQFVKGGFLVRGNPPAGLELYAEVELELSGAFGSAMVTGQIVQMVPNVGVAVAFGSSSDLDALVDAARAAGIGKGTAEHSLTSASTKQPATPTGKAATPTGKAATPSGKAATPSGKAAIPTKQVATLTGKAAQIHEARYGKKDARMKIIRGSDRSLHRHVITNPGLGVDEVQSIAKMTTIAVDLLKAIADRRQWAQRPEIAVALVRNPKTPIPLAIKLLNHVSPADLRQISKTSSVRMAILKAARKKVLS